MNDQIICYTCKGKGSYPVAGFLAVLDWPCSICKGTGKIDNPQNQLSPQRPCSHFAPIKRT